MFDAPHHVKAQQLKFVAGALRKETLRTYVPEIIRETEAYLDTNWGAEGEIDLMDEMAKLTINTASRCLLGRDVREKFGSNVAALLHQIDEGITPLAVINPYLPIESFRCVALSARAAGCSVSVYSRLHLTGMTGLRIHHAHA